MEEHSIPDKLECRKNITLNTKAIKGETKRSDLKMT